MIKYLSIILILLSLQANSQSHDWELAKDKNGIKVYTRTPEGSKFKEFKAIMNINTSNIDKITNILDDIEQYPDWQANLTNSKILKIVNSNEKYFYYNAEIPWPITDRDGISKVTRTENNGVILYTLKSYPDFIPKNEDYIRLILTDGSWKLTPLKNNKTQVVYQVLGDPEGSLPSWVVNMFIVDGPYTTFENLKKRIGE